MARPWALRYRHFAPLLHVQNELLCPCDVSLISFQVPLKGRILLGTYHFPRCEVGREPRATEEEIEIALDEINRAIPGFDAKAEEVVRVMCGYLPTTRAHVTRQATKETIYDHGCRGGPEGLLSVSGVKYTTAPVVADKTVRWLFKKLRRKIDNRRAGHPEQRNVTLQSHSTTGTTRDM